MTPMERFEMKECYENNLFKMYEIANVGYVTMSYVWINSEVSYITKNINKLEEKLISDQLSFELLDKSMKLLERPFEEVLKTIQKENFGHIIAPNDGLTALEKNDFEMTEKVEDIILKVTGQPLVIWENIMKLVNNIILVLLVITLLYKPDFVNVFFLNLVGIIYCYSYSPWPYLKELLSEIVVYLYMFYCFRSYMVYL
jgi:hypothetical protein